MGAGQQVAVGTHAEIAESYLEDECVVRDPTTVSDGAGGRTTTYADGATVPCHFGPLSEAEQSVYAERVGDRATYRVSLPVDTTVTDRHRLTAESRTLDVLSVSNPPGASLMKVTVVEVEDGA